MALSSVPFANIHKHSWVPPSWPQACGLLLSPSAGPGAGLLPAGARPADAVPGCQQGRARGRSQAGLLPEKMATDRRCCHATVFQEATRMVIEEHIPLLLQLFFFFRSESAARCTRLSCREPFLLKAACVHCSALRLPLTHSQEDAPLLPCACPNSERDDRAMNPSSM